MSSDPAPFADQLAEALRERQVSQSELARRLAALDGAGAQSKRRLIQKWLAGEVDEPEEGSMRAIEKVLRLPRGWFRRQPQAEPATPAQLRRRLELAENGIERLAQNQSALLEHLALELHRTADGNVQVLPKRPTSPS